MTKILKPKQVSKRLTDNELTSMVGQNPEMRYCEKIAHSFNRLNKVINRTIMPKNKGVKDVNN